MKIPYFTNAKTRKIAKTMGVGNRGGIAVKAFGIILYELPITKETLKLVQ